MNILDDIRILDFTRVLAGPFASMIMADLGAEVIKINGLYDMFWHRVHIAYMSNRGKKSLTLNLKDPRSMKVFLDLVKDADVVHHNMRYDAAERLKIDYESLKQINPKLIYCHTRGFETGERSTLPGNDQTGARGQTGGIGNRKADGMISFVGYGRSSLKRDAPGSSQA